MRLLSNPSPTPPPWFNSLSVVKNGCNVFFHALILVVWKYAQMHQSTFFNHVRPKNFLFSGQDFGGLENLRKCIKTRFEPLQTLKISWKDAQMHQNTFLTTSDLKKYFFFRP
jgi:hypothetical protein